MHIEESSIGKLHKRHTLISPTYKNCHPLRLTRTAKSMSSTVVRSFHLPASLIADTRHTPAVPAKVSVRYIWKLTWLLLTEALTVETKESMHRWAWLVIPAQPWNDNPATSFVSLSLGKHHSSLQNFPAKATSGTSWNQNEQHFSLQIIDTTTLPVGRGNCVEILALIKLLNVQ